MTGPDVDRPAFAPDWALFLDVDGTLLDLAEHPDDVQARPEVIELLAGLHRLSGGALALVSGRSLATLDEIFAPLCLAAAGQHGHERRDASGRIHRDDHDAQALARVRAELERFVTERSGTHVEDKGASVALHYRSAGDVAAEVDELTRRLRRELPDSLRLQPGKMVVEIKPSGQSKGDAVADFMNEEPFAGRRPVFVGDDVTDEDGFRWVNEHGGVSVKVGGGDTAARYTFAGVDAVVRWLREYQDFLAGERKAGS